MTYGLVDVIRAHSFCFEPDDGRYRKAVATWDRRVRLRSGDDLGEFEVGDIPLSEYPRPDMVRGGYTCLNGRWRYAIVSCREYVDCGGDAAWAWQGEILVPFSPECDLSGVGRILNVNQVLIYERTFAVAGAGRTLLHLDAVDQICEIRIGGKRVGLHVGGYLPITLDITDYVCAGDNDLQVHVVDFTDRSALPKGKQTMRRGGIWYTPQSGIWGSVWTEQVPATYIGDLCCVPDYDRASVDVRFTVCGEIDCARIVVSDGDREIVSATVDGGGTHTLPMGAFVPWSPECPHLYTVVVTAGQDCVQGYFGMRKIECVCDARGQRRIRLNGRDIFQSGVLDQGYYPESLLTPPCDRAMISDIERIKACGFNMLRKHIKIEPRRWYYHCDRLGMLVWQDMVSGGDRYRLDVIAALPFAGVMLDDTKHYRAFARADARERERYRDFVGETVEYLRAFPSIVLWCIFNEGWGQFDSVEMTRYVRSIDDTRLIDSVSGWHDQGKDTSDFKSMHVYFRKVCMPRNDPRCVVLSEFGGYSMPVRGHMQMPNKLFGYKIFRDRERLRAALRRLYDTQVIPYAQRGLCAAVYTQLSDVEEEINGILTYDRKVDKFGRDLLQSMHRRLYAAYRAGLAEDTRSGLRRGDAVELIADLGALCAKGIRKGCDGAVVSFVDGSEFVFAMFANPHQEGDYAVVAVHPRDLRSIGALPEQTRRLLRKIERRADFYGHTKFAPYPFCRDDRVELLSDAPAYAQIGVCKGMRGRIAADYPVTGCWQVAFETADGKIVEASIDAYCLGIVE